MQTFYHFTTCLYVILAPLASGSLPGFSGYAGIQWLYVPAAILSCIRKDDHTASRALLQSDTPTSLSGGTATNSVAAADNSPSPIYSSLPEDTSSPTAVGISVQIPILPADHTPAPASVAADFTLSPTFTTEQTPALAITGAPAPTLADSVTLSTPVAVSMFGVDTATSLASAPEVASASFSESTPPVATADTPQQAEVPPGSAPNSVPDYTAASPPQQQWFFAGATLTTMPRAEAIPGRIFYDFDKVTVKPPIEVMHAAGFNAVRVETSLGQCIGPDLEFDNSGDVLGREMNYLLDFGCISTQVAVAVMAKARNMKIILTVNFGPDIPTAWYDYTYVQMLQAIDVEVRRQIAPFLQAGVQPDIVLLENEGSAGFLYNIVLPDGTTYARGSGGSGIPNSQVQQEVSGQLPTGAIQSYPQLAGYYKQEIISLTAAIQQVHTTGMSMTTCAV